MKQIHKVTSAIVLFIGISVGSAQAASDGSYAVYGHGGQTCGAYLEALSKGRSGRGYNDENEFIIWVRGFLSAYNRYTPNTYSIIGSADLEGVMAYIENYCRRQPLSGFGSAVEQVAEELYPRRRLTPR